MASCFPNWIAVGSADVEKPPVSMVCAISFPRKAIQWYSMAEKITGGLFYIGGPLPPCCQLAKSTATWASRAKAAALQLNFLLM